MRSDRTGLHRQQPCPECDAPPGRACENADGRPFAQLVHTQRANVPPDQVERWKKAITEHNAAKRRQRQRPDPPTAGYRAQPRRQEP